MTIVARAPLLTHRERNARVPNRPRGRRGPPVRSPAVPGETIKAPTGTHDLLPPESGRWQALERVFADRAGRSGFGLLRTPVFEDVGVFHRVGEATDVVR